MGAIVDAKAFPKIVISNHAVVQYLELVRGYEIEVFRKESACELVHVDQRIQEVIGVQRAELLVLRRRMLDRFVVERLAFYGFDIFAIREEILTILSKLPDWSLRAIQACDLGAVKKIVAKNMIYFFDNGKLTHLKVCLPHKSTRKNTKQGYRSRV